MCIVNVSSLFNIVSYTNSIMIFFVFLDKYIHCEKICITMDDLVMLSFIIFLLPQYLHLANKFNVQFKAMSPAGLLREL